MVTGNWEKMGNDSSINKKRRQDSEREDNEEENS